MNNKFNKNPLQNVRSREMKRMRLGLGRDSGGSRRAIMSRKRDDVFYGMFQVFCEREKLVI